MKKRVISALLALCMACSLAGTAWAEDTAPDATAGAPAPAAQTQSLEGEPAEATPETAQSDADEAASAAPADEAADYPARTVEQTVPGADVTVKVDVPAGALPEDAVLTTSLVGTSEDTHQAEVADVAAELDAADVEYDGFVALDISFADADGAKVEPLQPVSVNFSLPSEMLPEDADPESLAVQHLAEDETGAVEAVETVADAADVTDGTIAVDAAPAVLAAAPAEAPMPQDAQITAEFEVDGFSTFTITWNANNAHSREFTITCYDADTQQQLSSNLSPEDLMLGTGNEFVFNAENTKLELANYEVESATIKVGNYSQQQNLYSIKATYDWDRSYYTYTYKTSANGSEQTISSSQNVTISVYYKRVSEEATGNLSIDGSNIADTGAITAAYNGTLPQGAYYKWYRQLADGTWQQVSGQVGDSLEIYRDGARVTYKVELWQLNGTQAVDESAPFQVPYYDQLQNGSFEDTPVSGSNLQFTNGLYPEMVWQTTGLGELNTDKHADGQDIEIVNASALQNNSNNPYGVTQARAGNQLAELNCEYEGALYQDVLTAPGVDLTWWASHRARNLNYNNHDAEDTMYVVIMDAEVAAQYVTTQDEIDNIVEAAQRQGLQEGKDGTTREATTVNRTYGGETVPVTVWKITSGINETSEKILHERPWWQGGNYYETVYTETNGGFYDYGDTYLVPEGQYLTRFFFAAGNTSTNNRTVGNLLDRVGFSQYPPTPENQGAIAITKTVTGLDEDITIPAGSFTFTVNGQVVKLPTSDAKPTQTSAWTATVNLTPGTYTVTEDDPSSTVLSEGYQYSSTSSNYNGNVVNGLTSSEILVQNGNTSAVVFTNTYTPTTGTLVVTKQVEGWGDPDQMPSTSFTFNVYAGDATTGDPVATFALPDNSGATPVWTKELTLPAGSYTVVEEQPGQNGTYQYDSTQIAVGDEQASTGLQKAVSVVANETTNVTVTNKYKPYTGSLTIKKKVDGLTGGANANNTQFQFTITGLGTMFKEGETSKTFDAVDAAGTPVADVTFSKAGDAATATVTIKGEGSLKINGLPLGTYTVQETSAPDIGDFYCDLPDATVSKTISNATKTELDQTATITNTYKPYKTLTIKKTVTGEMGTATDEFDFAVAKTNGTLAEGDVTVVPNTGVDDSSIEFADSKITFKLKNGGQVTLGHLKDTDVVTITETDPGNGYKLETVAMPTTGSDDGAKVFTRNQNVVTATLTNLPEDTSGPNLGTVTFTNKRQAVAPTGLESDHNAPFALMVGAAFLAGAALLGNVVLRRRRRWQE